MIEKTGQAIEKYKSIKQGMMHDLFTRGLDENGKLRPRYEDAPLLYKKTKLGWLPKEWDVSSISEITTYVGSGITPTGGSNVYKEEGILFIRSQNVHFDGLRLDDIAYIDIAMHDFMERSKVRVYDVLLNITGASIGRCCPFAASLGQANVNQHVCIIRIAEPSWNKAVYLSSVLASPIGQNQIARLNAGGNREGLNYQQLRAFFIPWPNEETEINAISDKIESCHKKLMKEQGFLSKMHLIKIALMQDLLTGLKRVEVE